MAEELEVMSLDEAQTVNDTDYDIIEDAYGKGKHLRIGSLGAKTILKWIEDNDDPAKKKEAGLRLIVESVVDKDGNRYSEEQREAALEAFRNKNSKRNGQVVQRILKLNGLDKAAKKMEAEKNDSGEVIPSASPTDSPATSAE